MPELLTKHPDIVKKVLQGTPGVVCGRGPRRILEQCPLEWFCRLPTGELCIYGPDNWPEMTQMDPSKLPRRSNYCSQCGRQGHNRRTCR